MKKIKFCLFERSRYHKYHLAKQYLFFKIINRILKRSTHIQAHLLTQSPLIKKIVQDSLFESRRVGRIIPHSQVEEFIGSIESSIGTETLFCIVEESSLVRVDQEKVNSLLNLKVPILFIKNSEEFHLKPTDSNLAFPHLFLDLKELSPTFMDIFIQMNDQRFSSSSVNKKYEDIQIQQAMYIHEIRNPLTVIKGKCQAIIKCIPAAKKNDPWIQEIIADCEKVFLAVEKIRDISQTAFDKLQLKSNKKKIEIDMERCELADIIWAAMENASSGFETSVEIIDHIDPVEISCHRKSFEGALINLIKNAYEAIHKTKNPWIRITSRVKHDLVIIRVIDSGNGIVDDEKIFLPFFTTKEKQGGTGIGLEVVKNFTDSMGGTVTYLKDENKNTCFELVIPIKSSPQTA